MNPTAIYSKSGKGVQEASGKTSHLRRAERAVLAAIDGRATLAEVADKCGKPFDPAFEAVISQLDKDGFVREVSPGVTPKAPAAPAAKGKPAGSSADGPDLDFSAIAPTLKAAPPAGPSAAELKAKADADRRAKEQEIALSKARQEAEARAQTERERMRKEAEDKIRAETETRMRAEAEAKMRAETDSKAKVIRAATEAKVKAEAEAKKAREEAERARKEADEKAAKARKEAEEKAKREQEEMRRQLEAERTAREAAEKKAREEADRARKEAEEKAKREQEEMRRQLEEERKRLEAEHKAREEEDRQRREEEERAKRERDKQEEQERAARRKKEEEEEQARRRKREEEEARYRKEEEERAARRKREEEEERARREREKQEEQQRAQERARKQSEATVLATPAIAPPAPPPPPPQQPAGSATGGFADSLLADLDSFGQREEQERKEKEAAERKAREDKERRAREAEDKRRREEEERARKEADERRRREDEERRAREEEQRREREEEERRRLESEERKLKARESLTATQAPAAAAASADDIGVSEDDLDMDDVKADEAKVSAESRRAKRERERDRERGEEARGVDPVIASKPKRPVKWGKPLALALFVLLIAGVGAIHVMPVSVAEYETAASEALGQPVKLGSGRLSLFTGVRVKFDHVTVGSAKIASVRAYPELGSLFGAKKSFSRIELEGLVLPQQAIGEALFTKLKGERLRVARVSATQMKLDGPLALPAVDADAMFAADGALRTITLRGADALMARITPKESEAEFEMTTGGFAVPFAPGVKFSAFGMKGTANRQGMKVTSWDGAALTGSLSGSANIKWGSTWIVDGVITARGINAGVFAPALLSEGRGEGTGKFSMSGEPAQLASTSRVEANFTVTKGALSVFDLSRAIQTAGRQASGRTVFAEMTGQATYDKGAVALRNVTMGAGALNAGISADIAESGALSGRIVADVKTATQTLKATFSLSGTVKEPQVRN
jgi:hypothetical protein